MKNTDTRSASVGMFYLYTMIIITILLAMTSCASQKRYVSCDAYKTHYKPIKAERGHSHHIKCDAYN